MIQLRTFFPIDINLLLELMYFLKVPYFHMYSTPFFLSSVSFESGRISSVFGAVFS